MFLLFSTIGKSSRTVLSAERRDDRRPSLPLLMAWSILVCLFQVGSSVDLKQGRTPEPQLRGGEEGMV